MNDVSTVLRQVLNYKFVLPSLFSPSLQKSIKMEGPRSSDSPRRKPKCDACWLGGEVKKLPKVLVIQLKRFDYDWERSGWVYYL